MTATVIAIVVVAVVVAEAVAFALTWPALERFGSAVGSILDLISDETKPSVGAVGEILRDAVVSLSPVAVAVLLIVIIVTVLARGPLTAAVRAPSTVRAAFNSAGRAGVKLGVARSLLAAALIAGIVIAAAIVALALTVFTASTSTVVTRGTTLVLVTPSAASIVAMVIAASLAVVPGSSLVRATMASAPAQILPRRDPASGYRSIAVAGIVLLALAGLLLVAGALASPIADDYKYFSRIDEFGPLGYVPEHMRVETGRYTSALAIAFAYAVFGTASTQIVPVILILGLGMSAALVAREFVPFDPGQRILGPAFVGLASTVVAVSVAPSVFDSYLWLTSSLVYIPPLVLAGSLVIAIRRAESSGPARKRWTWRVIAGVIVAGIQGFNEPLAVLLVLVLLALAIVSLARRHPAALFRVALAAVAIAGVLVLGLAPSQANRIDSTATGSLPIALAGAFYGPLQFLAALGWGHLLLILGVGVLLGAALGGALVPQRRAFTITGLVMVVVPLPLSSFISCFGTGWAAWRTYSTGGALLATGAVILVACLVSFVTESSPRRALRVMAAIALVVAALPVSAESLTLIRAEAIRASLMAHRDALVADAIASDDEVIHVIPAPILVSPSDARDFEFSAEQSKDWFSYGYRQYFGIDEDVVLRYATTPPAGYCLGTAPAPSVIACDDSAP